MKWFDQVVNIQYSEVLRSVRMRLISNLSSAISLRDPQYTIKSSLVSLSLKFSDNYVAYYFSAVKYFMYIGRL